MSFCQKLKISVTTELIGLYSSDNIPPDSVMVLSYFLRRWKPPAPPPPTKKKKIYLFLFKTEIQKREWSFNTPPHTPQKNLEYKKLNPPPSSGLVGRSRWLYVKSSKLFYL